MKISTHTPGKTLSSVFAVILLTLQSALALVPTPGQMFETAFVITPSLLGTTNAPVDIRVFQNRSFATNEWVVSFDTATDRFDNIVVPFSVSNSVSCRVTVGFAEQSQSPEQAFWTAATRLAANAKPMFVVANEWPATVDTQGILFTHTPIGSASTNELMRLERNLLVYIEVRQGSNSSDLLGWIVSRLQNDITE